MPARTISAALVAAFLASSAHGRDVPQAAPPPLSDNGRSPALLGDDPLGGGKAMATTEYSQGDPSDEEQLFLEYMNRARLDPRGEADLVLEDYGVKVVRDAVSFFLKERPGVEYTRAENHDAFDAIPPAQPFAFHPALIAAARNHSVVMRTVDQQTHNAVGEATLRQRTTAAGYESGLLSESIFAFAKTMLHAHAGFAVDWGQACECNNGERPPTGHRDALMNNTFREVGVGVVEDSDRNTRVGPLLITIDFAEPRDDTTRLVTGVVYEDKDEDGFYSLGEGIEGVRIETDASDFFAVSSASGGYAVPVPRDAGTVRVFAMGEPGTESESVADQEVVVEITDANVKVDFGPKPEPPVPVFAQVQGGAAGLGDGLTTSIALPVGALDPENPTLGDIEVDVDLTHGDRGELTVVLRSPSGTAVTLFDGSPSGSDLRGTFDRTLATAEPLSAFVGETYQGTWTLDVTDAAGGVTDGQLASCALRIRPSWIRPLHAPSTPLAVKLLKLKDSRKPGKDAVTFVATVNADGRPLSAVTGGLFRLVDASNDALFLEVDLPAQVPTAKAATPEGANVKAKLKLNRAGSSKGTVTVKVSGLEVEGPLPASVRVELVVGDAVLTETLSAVSNKAKGVPRFFVDKLKSKRALSGNRSTTIAGRFAPQAPGAISGVVDLVVGTERIRLDAEELTVKGNKLIFKNGKVLKKLVVDLVKGKFSAKIASDHEVRVEGTTRISLRLGDSFYGDTDLLPFDKGTKTQY